MGALQRLALLISTAGLAASTSSCFAVTNLDRFQQGGGSGNFTDLRLTVRGMTSHVAELFEYRIVDKNNTLQSRGQIFPLGGPDATLFASGAVPKQNAPFNLDFYADHDNSGGYDRDEAAGTGDHSWRIPLTDDLLDPKTGAYVITFDHNTSFSVLTSPAPPIEIGTPAKVHLANMGAFMGKRIELRIADASSKRVVVLYRVPVLGAATYDVTIPGMIEAGVTYTVELYTDDGATPPGSIRAFRVDAKSVATGLDLVLDPALAPPVDDAASP